MKTSSTCHRFLTRIMRVFFYLLYHPMAWSYDFVSWLVSFGRWKTWIKSVLPFLEGSTILEIGHGPGHLQKALFLKDIKISGIDSSHQMGQQARKQILKQGFTPRLTRSYAQKLPFPECCFDQIVTTFPTEYIYDPKTLKEAYRILKPGGTIVIIPAAWVTGKNPVDRSIAALFRVTGQSPDWDVQWLEPFIETGFKTNVKMISQTTWSLVIIFAKKIA
jgi:ubiquinone/menaquinone biosynthesis C-methylase UbiE